MELWADLQEYMEMTPCGVLLLAIGDGLEILSFNELICTASGYTREELQGEMKKTPLSAVAETQREAIFNGLAEAAAKKIPYRRNIPVIKADKTTMWVNMTAAYLMERDGDMVYRCILMDNTVEKEAERQIEEKKCQLQFQLEHDALTKGYNRKAFYQYTSELLKTNAIPYAIITLDIVHFKVINELYGIEAGDAVLFRLAKSIREYVGEKGLSGRLTSDHFAICMPLSLLNPDEMMEKLQENMASGDMELRAELYAGIFQVDDVTLPVSLMCDRADLAMGTVKGSYLRHYAYYDESMKERLLEEQQLLNDMQTALEKEEICFYMQPVYSITKGGAFSAEALVRWNHPVKGVISPGVFIPLAEKNGFVVRIDWYVWELVCKYIAGKKRNRERYLPVSVNMSRMNFYIPDICGKIQALIKRYGVEASEIRFEITEGAYMEDPQRVIKIVEQFRASGFKVLMDDFGKEYSSLNMLKDIPVDYLKIDMCFLNAFEKSGRAANVITSVVRMAKWLDIAVIAEGVETGEQQRFLRSIGCDLMQGYYYSKPLNPEDFDRFLKEHELVQSMSCEMDENSLDIDALFYNPEVNYLFNGMMEASGLYDLTGEALEVLRVNDSYYEMMKIQPDEVLWDAKDSFTHVWEEDKPKLLHACNEAKVSEDAKRLTIRRNLHRGGFLWLDVRIRFIGSRGESSLFLIIMRDITEQKLAMTELQQRRESQRHNELFRMLMEASDMIIYDYDIQNDEMFYSIPVEDGTRKSWEIQRFTQVIQQSPLIHRDSVRMFLEYLIHKSGHTNKFELDHRADFYGNGYRWYRTAFRSVRDEAGVVNRVIGQVTDITETRKLRERAERDGMTGLLNRQTIEHRINKLVLKKKRAGVFYLLDVDNFKMVNDTCGHTVGDVLLMCIAKLLDMKFRNEDLKSRLGGDEFAVLTINPMEESMVYSRGEELLAGVRQLQKDLQIPFPVSISVGIAHMDEDILSFEHLYEKADMALYQAKHGGKDRYCSS